MPPADPEAGGRSARRTARSSSTTSARPLDRAAAIRALAHPLRGRIWTHLQLKRASPRQLAEELDAPLGNVSYHVRTLLQLKLIKLVKTVPRRGAIEHYYEAVERVDVPAPAWGETPGLVKQAVVDAALQEIGHSVTQAANLGGFDAADAHLTRTRLTLDRKGWEGLAEALMDVLRKAEQLEEESRERLESGDDHDGERTSGLVMMLFDHMVVPSHAPAAREGGDEGAAGGEGRGGRARPARRTQPVRTSARSQRD